VRSGFVVYIGQLAASGRVLQGHLGNIVFVRETNEMKKLILIPALGLVLAACAGEPEIVVVTATLSPPTATPVTPTATSVPPTPTITPVPWDGEVNAISTGLRQQPHLNSRVIKALPARTKVDLLATTEDQKWVRVTAYFEGTKRVGWLQVAMLKLNVSLDDLEVDTETAFV
jgi:hypothetical protein